MRDANGFHAQFSIQEQLGKGHFATVYLAVEKATGMKYAIKKFDKRTGPGEKSKVEGLQQEIGVLMGVSHPSMLCLKDTFNEVDGVYLVLELAAEGELFNWIVMKSKLTESETRKVFIQLFQGLKYLVRVSVKCTQRNWADISPSMSVILCIETSSRRTFYLSISSFLSSLLILG